MARRATRTKSGTELVVVNASSPPARRSSGGIRRRSRGGGKKRRGRSRGHSGGAAITTRIERTVMGGFGFGLVRKHFPEIPKIPGIGTSGTIALAVYFLKPSSPWIQDIGIAAAAIAGASFGETGSISGEDDVLTT